MNQTLNLDLPMIVTIGNRSDKPQYFQPCKENFLQKLEPGNGISFNVNDSFEALYYEGQATKDILVSLVGNQEVSLIGGVYDDETGEYTDNSGSYTLLQKTVTVDNGTPYPDRVTEVTVIGYIPYMEANPSLGLEAGNRLAYRIRNPHITSRSDLANGIICKSTNRIIDGYNEYTKAAFEDDGSLIMVQNYAGPIEILINWSPIENGEFQKYIVKCEAELEPAPTA